MKTFARWINVALGAWLVVAPFVLGYDFFVARRNDLWSGILVAGFALFAMAWSPMRWANTLMGIWLVVAPFVLGYADWNAATINAVVVGLAVLAMSLVPTVEHRRERRTTVGRVPDTVARPVPG